MGGAVLLVVSVILGGGCGGSSPEVTNPAASRPATMTGATLILDFVPNAVHAGIYRALAAGYYRQGNVDLRVIQPASTADTLRLIDAGKADFGIADGADVADQIDRGRDAQAVMALVQRPLGGLITLQKEGLGSPRQLEGRAVGLTGVPSDSAVLDTVVRDAGGDPKKVQTVTIGFNGVQDLEAGKVAGFTGFWPADGVQVQTDGFPTTTFKLDDYGGPAYPGLVLFSTRGRLAANPPLARALVRATVRGYGDTLADPERSLQDLLARNRSLQRGPAEASLRAYLALFQGDAPSFGEVRADRVRQLTAWLLRYRLIRRTISPSRYATGAFLPSA